MARAILIAAQNGLKLPIVYNTNAYDSVEVLQLLDGTVDIYLPDLNTPIPMQVFSTPRSAITKNTPVPQ